MKREKYVTPEPKRAKLTRSVFKNGAWEVYDTQFVQAFKSVTKIFEDPDDENIRLKDSVVLLDKPEKPERLKRRPWGHLYHQFMKKRSVPAYQLPKFVAALEEKGFIETLAPSPGEDRHYLEKEKLLDKTKFVEIWKILSKLKGRQ